jgi:hypothetical protein
MTMARMWRVGVASFAAIILLGAMLIPSLIGTPAQARPEQARVQKAGEINNQCLFSFAILGILVCIP